MSKEPWIEGAIFAFGLICILICIIYINNMAKCNSKWEDSKFGFFSGCLVNHDGRYIPENNVRVIKWINE